MKLHPIKETGVMSIDINLSILEIQQLSKVLDSLSNTYDEIVKYDKKRKDSISFSDKIETVFNNKKVTYSKEFITDISLVIKFIATMKQDIPTPNQIVSGILSPQIS